MTDTPFQRKINEKHTTSTKNQPKKPPFRRQINEKHTISSKNKENAPVDHKKHLGLAPPNRGLAPPNRGLAATKRVSDVFYYSLVLMDTMPTVPVSIFKNRCLLSHFPSSWQTHAILVNRRHCDWTAHTPLISSGRPTLCIGQPSMLIMVLERRVGDSNAGLKPPLPCLLIAPPKVLGICLTACLIE